MHDSPTIPEGLDVIPAADGVIIRKLWLTWKTALLGLFAIFWDSFLFFWYSQALSKPNPSLMILVFPLLHVGVGVGITYYVLASLVNKTDIVVSSAGVSVVIGPAPWVGNKTVKAGEITGVMVRERSSNRNSRSYNVMYADGSRKERRLVTSLSESDQAEFIAQTIRRTMRIAPIA
jgi:hypothetical protein